MQTEVKNIAIVGAGLVGSLLSIFLARRGYRLTVYEQRPDMRKVVLPGGRSINLALSNRGLVPLSQVGLEAQVKEMVIKMNGRVMHDLNGALTFQPYGKEGEFINSVSRGGLNSVLMATAENSGVSIIFETIVEDIDIGNTRMTLLANGQRTKKTHDLIIGADGAFSAVRTVLQKTDRFDYSQYFIPHGYKEFSLPASKNGDFQIEPNALHIWPRGNFMLIALPNLDRSFTCTLFLPFEGESSFSNLVVHDDVLAFFNRNFEDAVPILTDLHNDWQKNPTSSMVTVKCGPWFKNRTMIMGDAAHAIVPFYGQGMNCGFEDCKVLDDLLNQHDDQWDTVIPAFYAQRKEDADAISELALRNFVEMRDLVADDGFLLRKKIEARIHELFPEKWIPLYSMVTFRDQMRYSEALRIGRIQDEIMDEIMSSDKIDTVWESLDYERIAGQLSSSL